MRLFKLACGPRPVAKHVVGLVCMTGTPVDDSHGGGFEIVVFPSVVHQTGHSQMKTLARRKEARVCFFQTFAQPRHSRQANQLSAKKQASKFS